MTAESTTWYRCGKRHRLNDYPNLSKSKNEAAYNSHNNKVTTTVVKDKSGVTNFNIEDDKGRGDDKVGAASPSPEDRANLNASMQ